MMERPEFVGKIVKAERLNCTVNGNPRYRIEFDVIHQIDNITRLVSSDSACSYDVENLLHSGEQVYVWTTRAGRVYRMDRVFPSPELGGRR